MQFFSDNAAAACPEVIAAIVAANPADGGYDGDALSRSLDAAFSALFETEVAALWVSTGTAANALALAALCPPHGGVLCHRDAHIQNDECGAPEFYTHGAKLLLVDGDGAKLTAGGIAARAGAIADDVHRVQPHAISITNATEYGLVYAPEEIAAIGAFASEKGLGFHMDGARFANAVVASGARPAALTWAAGVDMLSFGFVKNGGMSAEALICFDPARADLIRLRRKRGGHLLSKGRFAAAQILALLRDDLWLRNARAANDAAARIAAAAGDRLLHPVQANEVLVAMSAAQAAALRAEGFGFYDWAENEVRFVTAWDTRADDVDRLAEALARLP